MRITTKLNLSLILIVLLVGCLGVFVSAKGGALLRRSIEQRSMNLADGAINEVDEAMFYYINDWRAFLETPFVVKKLGESNRGYDSLPDIEAHMDRIDREWSRSNPDERGHVSDEFLSEELSLALGNKTDSMNKRANHIVFEEVLLTNAYGANVAITGNISDFRQDDELWWQRAKDNGLYVSNIAFDENAGFYSVGICLRINDDEGAFVGVFKAVLDIRCLDDVLAEYVAQVSHSEIDASSIHNVLMLNTQGEILFSLRKTKSVHPGRNKYANLPFLASSEITETCIRKDKALGDILAIRARSSGYGAYRGQRWTVVIEQNAGVLFAPVASFQKEVLSASSAIAIVFASVMFLVSRSVSGRFRRVTIAMRDLSGPTWSEDNQRDAGDELEQLNLLATYIAESLCIEKAKNEAILASMDDAVIIFDEKGIIKAVSVGTSRLFKYHVEEVLGLDIGRIIPAIGDRLRETDGRAVSEHGAGRTFEVSGIKQNGETLPLEVSTSQAQIERQRLFAVIGRNIESRKGAEEKLEATMAELKSFNDLAVGRELRMIALKQEVNELLTQLGRSEKYETDTTEQVA